MDQGGRWQGGPDGHHHHASHHSGHGQQPPAKNLHYLELSKITPNINIGYNYPGCTYEELRILDHAHEIAHPIQALRQPISPDQAAAELEDILAHAPNAKGRAALQRLKDAWTTPDWTPDIAIKSFNDLDRLYFGRTLKDRCRLRWKGSTRQLRKDLGECYGALGVTIRDNSTLVPVERIILNARIILLKTGPGVSVRKQAFETLIHEMVHAYLGIRCARDIRDIVQDSMAPDPMHGRPFMRCCRALNRRTMEDIGFHTGM